MSPALDYLLHLERESAIFLETMRDTAPDDRVPSCPDWNSDDLLWHLAEVQWFWGTIVQEGILESARADELKADRPGVRQDLQRFFSTTSGQLLDVLAAKDPATPAWTWADEQTVGFIRRRQAHEALIHRVDAELTAGVRRPMDAELCSDGVDEALRIMYGGVPAWADFAPALGSTVTVAAVDTGDRWLVTLGQLTGTSPSTGISYDEPSLHVATDDPVGETAAEIKGTAADLDCWLWGRPGFDSIARTGDPAALHRFDATIAAGID